MDIVYWEDFAAVISGVDELGTPISTASLSLDNKLEDNLEERGTVFFSNPVMDFYVRGGAAVAEVQFPKNLRNEAESCIRLCERYFNEMREYPSQEINMLIVPTNFNGEVVAIFSGLVYVTRAYTDELCTVILVFDHTDSIILKTDEIDMAVIKARVDSEIKRMEDDLEEQIQLALDEQKEIQELSNPYSNMIKEQLESNTSLLIEEEEAEEEEPQNSRIRIAQEEDE